MMLRRNLILLLRWHRRIALIAAIFVVVLALTGLLINHANELGLDKQQLQGSWVARWYGIKKPEVTAFSINHQWLAHDGVDSLYLNTSLIGPCQPPLHGAVSLKDILVALCEKELLLISPEGMVIERITPVFGLPEGASGITVSDNQLAVKTIQGLFLADIDTLEWKSESLPKASLRWSKATPPPTDILRQLKSHLPGVSVERLLLDLHSGRLFGKLGVYLMDLMAILFLFLAMSGIWAWVNYLRLKKKE